MSSVFDLQQETMETLEPEESIDSHEETMNSQNLQDKESVNLQEGTMNSQNQQDNLGRPPRCAPHAISELGILLSETAREFVKSAGFHNMLREFPSKIPKLTFVMWLMDRVQFDESGNIALTLKEGMTRTLTKEDVYLILGIGKTPGERTDLPSGNQEYPAVLKKLHEILSYASRKLAEKGAKKSRKAANKSRVLFTKQCIKEVLQNAGDDEIKKHFDDEMAAKLFCFVVLDKLLISPGFSTVPKSLLDAVLNLDELKKVDWSTLVFNKLKESIVDWKTGSRNLTGCIYLLIVSILVSLLFLCRQQVI